MDALAFLISGANLPFLAALGCGVLLALFQILSGAGQQQADAEADADLDADADVDAHAPAASGGVLGGLGVGKVPLTLVLMALLVGFGSIGLLANGLIRLIAGGYPEFAFPLVLIGSILLALPLTARISAAIARLAPRSSTAINLDQLVGRAGLVVHSVSRTYGRVQVRDMHGSVHTVFAVVEQDEPLPEQTEVALVAYDPAQRQFVVRRLEIA